MRLKVISNILKVLYLYQRTFGREIFPIHCDAIQRIHPLFWRRTACLSVMS